MAINPQKMADAAHVVEEYERKLISKPSMALGIAAYRPLKQAEDVLSKVAETLSPKNVAYTDNSPNKQLDDKIKDFYSNAGTSNRKFTIPNTNLTFQNTIASLVNSDNTVEQKAATLLRDCLPCETRISSLLMFNPLESIMQLLQGFALKLKEMATQLLQALLNPTPFTPNLCDFLKVFNFACVPDLNALIMMLKRYLKLVAKPELPKLPSFGALIGAIIAPILGVVANIVSVWGQLVLGPVECILKELAKQIKKLDLSAAGEKNPITNAMKGVLDFLTKAQKDVKAFVDRLIQKFTSLMTMFQRSLFKTIKMSIDISSIFKMISIIVGLMDVLSFDISSCGQRTTSPDATANKVASNIKNMDIGRVFGANKLGKIDTFIPVNDLTKEERESLGIPPLVIISSDGLLDSTVVGDEVDKVTVKGGPGVAAKAIRGVTMSLSGCPENANRSFVDVSNLISSFEG